MSGNDSNKSTQSDEGTENRRRMRSAEQPEGEQVGAAPGEKDIPFGTGTAKTLEVPAPTLVPVPLTPPPVNPDPNTEAPTGKTVAVLVKELKGEMSVVMRDMNEILEHLNNHENAHVGQLREVVTVLKGVNGNMEIVASSLHAKDEDDLRHYKTQLKGMAKLLRDCRKVLDLMTGSVQVQKEAHEKLDRLEGKLGTAVDDMKKHLEDQIGRAESVFNLASESLREVTANLIRENEAQRQMHELLREELSGIHVALVSQAEAMTGVSSAMQEIAVGTQETAANTAGLAGAIGGLEKNYKKLAAEHKTLVDGQKTLTDGQGKIQETLAKVLEAVMDSETRPASPPVPANPHTGHTSSSVPPVAPVIAATEPHEPAHDAGAGHAAPAAPATAPAAGTVQVIAQPGSTQHINTASTTPATTSQLTPSKTKSMAAGAAITAAVILFTFIGYKAVSYDPRVARNDAQHSTKLDE